MIELRWTTKKTGLVLQYRQGSYQSVQLLGEPIWGEWTDVADVNGDVPRYISSIPEDKNEPPLPTNAEQRGS